MAIKQLKHILGEYLKGTDFKEINNTIGLQKAWNKMVGNPISKNTKISSFKNWIRLDLKYIDDWSFLLDFKIIFKTIFIIFSGKGH